jgi:GTP cyclohydrolase I
MNKNAEFIQGINGVKCDPELGKRVHQILMELKKEHPYDFKMKPDYETAHFAIGAGVANMLHGMGLDVYDDPSIKDTPRRVADMYVGELFRGLNYDFFPKCTTTPADEANHMVVTGGIETVSVCEHHFQTIYGTTWIAYIPKTKLLGLSKFARVTDFFARRPQVQERMTEQIYTALEYILETPDVAVVQRCQHFCMKARGVMQQNSWTETSKMGGKFFSQQPLREEFINALGR